MYVLKKKKKIKQWFWLYVKECSFNLQVAHEKILSD